MTRWVTLFFSCWQTANDFLLYFNLKVEFIAQRAIFIRTNGWLLVCNHAVTYTYVRRSTGLVCTSAESAPASRIVCRSACKRADLVSVYFKDLITTLVTLVSFCEKLLCPP